MGGCFDDTAELTADGFESEIADLPFVDCVDPHDNEVYHVETVAEGDYPGQEATATMADEACLAAFDG